MSGWLWATGLAFSVSSHHGHTFYVLVAIAGCSIAKCGQAFSLFRIPNFIICRIEGLAACIHLFCYQVCFSHDSIDMARISIETSEVKSPFWPEASICCLRYRHSLYLSVLLLWFEVQCTHKSVDMSSTSYSSIIPVVGFVSINKHFDH